MFFSALSNLYFIKKLHEPLLCKNKSTNTPLCWFLVSIALTTYSKNHLCHMVPFACRYFI